MKKQKTASVTLRISNSRKRKGIHSKKKQSKNKNSKNYKKPYNGQGK